MKLKMKKIYRKKFKIKENKCVMCLYPVEGKNTIEAYNNYWRNYNKKLYNYHINLKRKLKRKKSVMFFGCSEKPLLLYEENGVLRRIFEEIRKEK